MAVDHFVCHARRDLLFVAGRVILEVARYALKAELFLHAALAIARAFLASAVGQVMPLEAGDA